MKVLAVDDDVASLLLLQAMVRSRETSATRPSTETTLGARTVITAPT